MIQAIKDAHDRYFHELKGIATCLDLLQEGEDQVAIINELDRRVRGLGQTLLTVGTRLVKEAA